MKIVYLISRLLLGLVFVVFGLNGFLHFIPQQPMPDGLANQYVTALAQSHYISFVFAIQFFCGVLLLLNQFVPLALTLIAPVIVNILLFHALMEPKGLPPGLVTTLLWFLVFYPVRSAFAGLFQQRVEV